jgi:hypothetical protein
LTDWCSESPAFGKLQNVIGKLLDRPRNMKRHLIIIIFISIFNNISFGQDSDGWKKILFNSTTFKVHHDKYKIPADIIKVLFDTIADVANPKEKVNGCTGGSPHTKLKWFAVDKDENYVVFVTTYGYHNRNLCFLITQTSKNKPLVVEKIRGDLNFKEFKIAFQNQDITVEVWPDK